MTISILEASGWRQGSIVDQSDTETILKQSHLDLDDRPILVVASQSCDIANNGDPQVEFSVSREIENINGNFTYNKNARKLHCSLQVSTGTENIFSIRHIELNAFEKISVNKSHIEGLGPNQSIQLDDNQLDAYVGWLSARYSRPALPTSFNDRVRSADPKGKAKKIAKSGNRALSGIYVQIAPNREISPDERYSANLLGLIPVDKKSLRNEATVAIDAYAEILRNAGIDVAHAVLTEDEVSVAMLRGYKRFYFDDLSYKETSSFPPELNN